MTNPFFYNTDKRRQNNLFWLRYITNTVDLLQEHQGENTEKD